MTITLSLTNLPSTLINRERVTLGQNLGEEGVDRCNPNFHTIWVSYAKEIVFDIFCYLFRHNARTCQTHRQTDRPRNADIDRNRRQ